MDIVGQIVSGGYGKIVVRQKQDKEIELGSLLVAEGNNNYTILQTYALEYASQISTDVLELAAGMQLEGYEGHLEFIDPKLRNYIIAELKSLVTVRGGEILTPKALPKFFANIREVTKEDLSFISRPNIPLYLGKIRSGSKILEVDVSIEAENALTHHILIPATTGRGKSNLVKVMLWSLLKTDNIGVLVLDPHDEYYGRHKTGLKDHPKARDNLGYYSPDALPGTNTLIVNLKSVMPWHFDGIIDFTDAQNQAISLYYSNYEEEWISNIIQGTEIEDSGINPVTLSALRRKIKTVLGVDFRNGQLVCNNRVFSDNSGESTVSNIVQRLRAGTTVIIDTSRLSNKCELLIGSIIASTAFNEYQRCKSNGELDNQPVISIVIEEAPRVLSGEVIACQGDNIYSTIAKEGRKFKIGLIAITQLVSVIPKTVLANMNTKIILGNEMSQERSAIISSASQDLSSDDQNIASLDKGEAIVSSIFTKFAIPLKVPLFEDYIKKDLQEKDKDEQVFLG